MKKTVLNVGTILITLAGICLLVVFGPLVLGGSYIKDWFGKN